MHAWRYAMQLLTLAFSSLAFFAGSILGAQDGVPLTADQILSKLASMESERNKRLPSYKVTRVYHLQIEKNDKSVTSTAEFEYRKDDGKVFRIVDEEGSEGLFRGALHKVMQAEVKAAKSEKDVEVGPDNYTASLLGKETKDGRQCYVLAIVPKRNSKYLIKGKAWIDTQEFGLVRLEGSPTENLSFWVGKPQIVQTFENFGGHWLLMSTESAINAKIVGHLKLSIKSNNYTWCAADSMKLARGN